MRSAIEAGITVLPDLQQRHLRRKPRIVSSDAGADGLSLRGLTGFRWPPERSAPWPQPGLLASLGLLFLKTGALVFGSGLAIVPLLRDRVAAQHHWLTHAQFLVAVAMG